MTVTPTPPLSAMSQNTEKADTPPVLSGSIVYIRLLVKPARRNSLHDLNFIAVSTSTFATTDVRMFFAEQRYTPRCGAENFITRVPYDSTRDPGGKIPFFFDQVIVGLNAPLSAIQSSETVLPMRVFTFLGGAAVNRRRGTTITCALARTSLSLFLAVQV